jgi:hypothetical protein
MVEVGDGGGEQGGGLWPERSRFVRFLMLFMVDGEFIILCVWNLSNRIFEYKLQYDANDYRVKCVDTGKEI